MKPHIVLIDIQTELISSLETMLSLQGYCVSLLAHQDVNRSNLERLGPDLLIMGMPTASSLGLETCQYLSSTMRRVPIMLLGSASSKDRVASLNICANAYLSVPFSTEEFLARVRAMVRRVSWDRTDEVFTFNNLRLDTRTREVHSGNRKIELTAKEFDLLKYFMAHPRQVLTQQQILDTVWPDVASTSDANVLQVYIRYLRQKLAPAGKLIQTIRSVGYVLREPLESKSPSTNSH